VPLHSADSASPLTTVYGVPTADRLFYECHAKAASIARYVGDFNRTPRTR
jgi:hypothetical protein